MVARHSLRIVVSCEDDLARAEELIRSASDAIVIEANTESGMLLEIEDFRHLAVVVGAAGADVSFASDDPLRRELARIVGIRVEAPEPVVSGVRRALESNAPTRKIERIPAGVTTGPTDQTVPSLSEALEDYTHHGRDESFASFSFVITPPVPRRTDGHHITHTAPWQGARRRGRRAGKVAAVATLSAVALIAASALILAALLAPQATITLVPTTSALNAEVRYGIAGMGAYDVEIEPQTVSTTMSFTATVPTSGVRTEPDGTATGEVLLTNPSTAEIVLPAGTGLVSPEGIGFSTTEDVVVPAADPFGTLTMGSAVAPVVADAPGPNSNLDAQALSGQLADGLFFSNREPIAGGTTREVQTVADEDLAALQHEAELGLAGQVTEQIDGAVTAEQRLVTGSIETGDVHFSFSHEAGADAEEVQVEAVQSVSAQAYNPAELEEMARAELNRRLTSALPRDDMLLAESIQVDAPQEFSTADGTTEYRMTASARSRAVLDQQVLDALRQDLVGADQEEAGLQVATLKGVARFNVEYGPEWFPFDWPPRLESRIAINIDDSATTETAAGTARP